MVKDEAFPRKINFPNMYLWEKTLFTVFKLSKKNKQVVEITGVNSPLTFKNM